jgi:hypothetical protein
MGSKRSVNLLLALLPAFAGPLVHAGLVTVALTAVGGLAGIVGLSPGLPASVTTAELLAWWGATPASGGYYLLVVGLFALGPVYYVGVLPWLAARVPGADPDLDGVDDVAERPSTWPLAVGVLVALVFGVAGEVPAAAWMLGMTLSIPLLDLEFHRPVAAADAAN